MYTEFDWYMWKNMYNNYGYYLDYFTSLTILGRDDGVTYTIRSYGTHDYNDIFEDVFDDFDVTKEDGVNTEGDPMECNYMMSMLYVPIFQKDQC
jgi:hypothetical protein